MSLLILFFVKTSGQPWDIVVAKDGSGQFTTIQAALNSTPNQSPVPIRIYIRTGLYFEKLIIPAEKTNITFIGESRTGTIISYDDYSGKPLPGGGEVGTGTSYSVLVRGNDFMATGLTFLNSAGPIAQAVALHVVADRVIITNCDIIGNQVIVSDMILKFPAN